MIKFTGEANTEWSEDETRKDAEGKDIRESVRLTGQEEYFSIQYYLLGGKNGIMF